MLIRLEWLRKVYHLGEIEINALNGISLEISEGEFVCLMGPSGSGKTTLLNILGCLARATSGDYVLDGVDVKNLSDTELARLRNKKMGFVFQTFNLLARASALENVEFPLIYAGVSRRERKERSLNALEEVGLADRVGHQPNELSGGGQQRVAIARALVNNPAIILADEPTGNLDTRTGKEIVKLLVRLNEKGNTIIMVTHNQEIAHYASRLITLRDGQIYQDDGKSIG